MKKNTVENPNFWHDRQLGVKLWTWKEIPHLLNNSSLSAVIECKHSDHEMVHDFVLFSFFGNFNLQLRKSNYINVDLGPLFVPCKTAFHSQTFKTKQCKTFGSTQRQKQKYPRYWKRLWSSFGFQSSVVTLGWWQLIILRSGSEEKGRGDHF